MELDMELADIICVFYRKDRPGIKFYDHSPSGSSADFAGYFPEGKFRTSFSSLSKAIWDDEINSEYEGVIEKTRGGSVTTRTIMVSETQFAKILYDISKQEGNSTIIIDTRSESLNNSDEFNIISQGKFNNKIEKCDKFNDYKESNNDYNRFKL